MSTGGRAMSHEKAVHGLPGWAVLFVLIAVLFGASYALVQAAREASSWGIVLWSLVLALDLVCLPGLTVVNPNEAKVLTLFGVYKGSIKVPGFWWVNPLTSRRRLSLRVRNFESGRLKVNDLDGNPIEIAARQRIVEGAVGMVEMALAELSAKRVVQLDEERKATMVSNLLVVLCSERGVEPVVNTGTLYQ